MTVCMGFSFQEEVESMDFVCIHVRSLYTAATVAKIKLVYFEN